MTAKEFARKVFAGQWPILSVGVFFVVAFALVVGGYWRRGALVMAIGVGIAAVMRLLLTDDRAGLLVAHDELLAVLDVGVGVAEVADPGDHLAIDHRHVRAARQVRAGVVGQAELVQGDLGGVRTLSACVVPVVDTPGAECVVMVRRNPASCVYMRGLGAETIIHFDAIGPRRRSRSGSSKCKQEEVRRDRAVVIERDRDASVANVNVLDCASESGEHARAMLDGETLSDGSTKRAHPRDGAAVDEHD